MNDDEDKATMKTCRCPRCGEEFNPEDFLVDDDDSPEDARLLGANPPKHLSVESEYADGVPVMTVRHRRVNPVALLLIPFTCVWAGGSLTGIYGTQIMKHAFDWKLSLFGIPFVLGSLVLVSLCLFMLFGRRVLTLAHGSGAYFCGVGPIGKTVRFSYDRETKVCRGEPRYWANGTSQPCLELKKADGTVVAKIGSGMDEASLAYVAAFLRRECRRA